MRNHKGTITYPTSIQDLNNPEFNEVMFGDKKAIDIQKGDQFKLDTKHEYWSNYVFTIQNVYVKYLPNENGYLTIPSVRLNVGEIYHPGQGSAWSWFTAGENFIWIDDA